MIYLCYRAWHRDMDARNMDRCLYQVLRSGGWMETHIISVDFLVPEHRVDFLILQWPCLERRASRDYVD